MGLVTGPQAGETSTLDVTQDARHRVLIGLSWDRNNLTDREMLEQVISGVKDVVFGDLFLIKANIQRLLEKRDLEGREEDDPHFDLDLSCLAFDSEGNLISIVDPDAWNAIDESGKVYHSGEDFTGIGGPDDEQVYIEMKDLPDSISDLFIIVQSDCSHSFDKVFNPQIRVTDSITNSDFLKVQIDKLEGSDRYGYVCCRIFKDSGVWKITNISQFCEFEEDWAAYLQQFRP